MFSFSHVKIRANYCAQNSRWKPHKSMQFTDTRVFIYIFYNVTIQKELCSKPIIYVDMKSGIFPLKLGNKMRPLFFLSFFSFDLCQRSLGHLSLSESQRLTNQKTHGKNMPKRSEIPSSEMSAVCLLFGLAHSRAYNINNGKENANENSLSLELSKFLSYC